MAEGSREVSVTGIGHPLVDRVDTGPGGLAWSVTESRARVIHLSPLRINLLARSVERGRGVVLVTDELSSLTHAFATVWREGGGAWVVRSAREGLRDGFTGRALDAIADVWRPSAITSVDDVAVGYLRPVRLDAMQVTAIVSVRHPARASTLLGGPLATLSEAALGVPPRVWGVNEPLGAVWDRPALTALLRDRMPGEAAVYAAGPGLAAVLSAQRTSFGVEELTHAQLGVPRPSEQEFADIRTGLHAALRELAATAMPLVALLLARPARRDLLVPPFLPPSPIPIGLLIGAPAVRGFDLDPTAMRARHGAEAVGRRRVPALLFDLGPLVPEAWTRLDEILADLDREQLDEALGLAGPKIDAERWDGSRRAQP